MQETKRTASYALVLVLFLVALAFAKFLDLDDKPPSHRLQYEAMPIAMSVLYFGYPYDYTGNYSVAIAFQNNETITQDIERVLDPAFSRGTDIFFWNADDRGLADYVILSTLLFGPTVKGLFNFYFIIFGSIIVAYLVGHWRSSTAISYLIFALTAFVMCLPLWTIAPFNGGESSVHMSETRLFELLSFFCITHFFFFALQRARATRLQIGALCAQLFLFVFLLHARSTILWQVVALVLTLTSVVTARYRRERALNCKAIAVAGAVIATVWVALPLYQHAVYNPVYFGHAGERMRWHNFIMGLSYNPEILHKYDIHAGDYGAIQMVLRFAHKDEPNFPIEDTTQAALDSVGGHGDYDWRAHEASARKLVIEIFKDNPAAFVKTFVYDKPKALLIMSGCLVAPSSNAWCNSQKPNKIMPSIVPWLVPGMLFVLMMAAWRSSPTESIAGHRSVWFYTICMTIFALTPSILFYVNIITAASFLMVGFILIFLLTDRFSRMLVGRIREERAVGQLSRSNRQ